MVDFSKLRERKGTNFDALQKSLEKSSGGGGFKKDERIWKPTEINGKSENVIRFLPISARDFELVAEEKFKEEDLTPLIKVVRHQFQGPNGWFVENSLQTFGESCPVRERDGPLWGDAKKRNDKPAQDILKKRLPKQDEYVNVLVIKDGSVPTNNGGVFLYQVPATIKKMIDKANKPEFESDVAFDPFDVWEGANLLLNLTYETKQIGGRDARVPIWTNVKWGSIGALLDGNEKEIETVWKKEYSLLEFHDRSKFKTYEQLKERLCKVMNEDENFNPLKGSVSQGSASDFVNKQAAAPAPAPMSATPSTPVAPAAAVAPATAPAAPAAAAPPAAVDDALDEFERMLQGG